MGYPHAPGQMGETGAIPGAYPLPGAPRMMVGPGGFPSGPRWALAERPWLILTIILLLGVGTAAAIGLSGPTVEAGSELRPLAPAGTASNTP
jgi:hypothetical protein